ncbi:hypothetical protein CK203_008007 [Vitis vinifera]|uniref:Uncharacterized protein n=1 Tax=Vitis vinifera TaxID=29760 RepID=A0A438K124_VITVI|nr:hypothetical protein CK203_008007 [Vitis vinifera]
MWEGTWEGKIDFMVAPVDDFKIILGMDFLRKVKVMPLPFLRSMVSPEEEMPCVVSIVTEGSSEIPLLSAMQVKKGLKNKQVTYMATRKEKEDGSGKPMPKVIKGVLEEFNDMMSPKLPKRLPPRRKENHKIELEPGAKPPAMGLYKMALPKLKELKRQLKKLLDAGFIQPSKAPYGAVVLF